MLTAWPVFHADAAPPEKKDVAPVFLSTSAMKQQGCNDVQRKVCKSSKTGYCEAVYIASDSAPQACKDFTPANIEAVCGSENASLFDTDKACIYPRESASCPKDVASITPDDVKKLYKCPALQKELCVQACGARYDTIDVRNFFQTDRAPGVLCQDTSAEKLKNGVRLTEDDSRKTCTEVHEGVSKWCTNYNKTMSGTNLGAFVQCQGVIP
jgi:hypothetical protein